LGAVKVLENFSKNEKTLAKIDKEETLATLVDVITTQDDDSTITAAGQGESGDEGAKPEGVAAQAKTPADVLTAKQE